MVVTHKYNYRRMPPMPVILFILSTFGMTAVTHSTTKEHKAWTHGVESATVLFVEHLGQRARRLYMYEDGLLPATATTCMLLYLLSLYPNYLLLRCRLAGSPSSTLAPCCALLRLPIARTPWTFQPFHVVLGGGGCKLYGRPDRPIYLHAMTG
jgi:hypothetical protein